ncbi:hypothetical protein [Parendozoicomonas haliclonae]|uniref:Uncharacterized protein n=1 Tax=Parendozoicomonas haliclonae TaxID=1960125 RepID=A0A1X7AGJ7_9GAMM|nr:hypothetical protein [Parendozoicomonas haliclonae]SMA38498.1 hypothetical protein EHSB41UT_00878 [Parendozoicomonas haliclonae]
MSGLAIFTGVEVMFYWLGVLSLACVQGLVWLRWKLQSSWISLVVLAAGMGTMLFAAAWAISSILEKEPQSASMSMMVIMLPGLVLATLGGRLAWK